MPPRRPREAPDFAANATGRRARPPDRALTPHPRICTSRDFDIDEDSQSAAHPAPLQGGSTEAADGRDGHQCLIAAQHTLLKQWRSPKPLFRIAAPAAGFVAPRRSVQRFMLPFRYTILGDAAGEPRKGSKRRADRSEQPMPRPQSCACLLPLMAKNRCPVLTVRDRAARAGCSRATTPPLHACPTRHGRRKRRHKIGGCRTPASPRPHFASPTLQGIRRRANHSTTRMTFPPTFARCTQSPLKHTARSCNLTAAPARSTSLTR